MHMRIRVVSALFISLMAHRAHADSPAPALKYPGYVNLYELAQPGGRYFYYQRQVTPLVEGDDAAKWTVFHGVKEQIGEWVVPYLNAQKIAAAISTAFPLEGQAALKSVDDLVADCAKILHVPKPDVWIRRAPEAACYPASASDRDILVLTSGLLELYEGRPDELRFLVGRELTHLKAKTPKYRQAAYGLLQALQTIDGRATPDSARHVLPTLALAWLLAWSRECELLADRGGLLCCQDEQAAYGALTRLLHGLKHDSPWFDREKKQLDVDKLTSTIQRLEDEPFVKIVLEVKRWSAACPFIVDRIRALQHWAQTKHYQHILARPAGTVNPNDTQRVTIRKIQAVGLASGDDTVNAYVVLHTDQERVMSTITVNKAKQASWTGLDATVPLADGQPLFGEIWNEKTIGKNQFVGGFVIYPINPANDRANGATVYRARLHWDWKERISLARQGLAEVTVEFSKQAE